MEVKMTAVMHTHIGNVRTGVNYHGHKARGFECHGLNLARAFRFLPEVDALTRFVLGPTVFHNQTHFSYLQGLLDLVSLFIAAFASLS